MSEASFLVFKFNLSRCSERTKQCAVLCARGGPSVDLSPSQALLTVVGVVLRTVVGVVVGAVVGVVVGAVVGAVVHLTPRRGW